MIPDDGFSSDVVRGIPAGLVDFLSPLQGAGMCRLAAQPTSIGLWTVYMHQYNVNYSHKMEVSVIRFNNLISFIKNEQYVDKIIKCHVNKITTTRSASD